MRTSGDEYFVIDRIFEITHHCPEGTSTVVLCKKLVCVDSVHRLPGHISERFLSLVTAPSVLKLSDIIAPCLLIEFPTDDTAYVWFLPNLTERDSHLI